MIVERLNVEALAALEEGPVGCDECGTADAVWGLRFEFASDSVDEPYTIALCEEHFQVLARVTGGRIVAAASPAPGRYSLTLDLRGVTIRDVEEKLIDVIASLHELNRMGRPVDEIDARVRDQGGILTACVPAPGRTI